MSGLKKLLSVIGLTLVLFLNGFAFADDPIRTFEGHNKGVSSVVFSPDGTTIASGSNDSTIKLWDAQSGKLLNTLKGHRYAVENVAFSPNGTTIASGGVDDTIKLWDAQSGKLLNILKGHRWTTTSVAFSPDGTTIASGSRDKTIKLWDAQSGRLLNTLKGHNEINSVAFSPDGTTIASGGYDETIKLWGTQSGRLLNTLKGHEESVYSVAFSPDGTTIVSGSYDKTIKLWDAQSGRLLNTLKGHKRNVYCVAFSPDGTTIVSSGSWDKTIRMWDTQSGKLLNTLKDYDGISGVAFNSDGTMIASGSWDKTIKLWDTSSYSESLANKVYQSIDHSDYTLLYTFTKKFYNNLGIVQQAYRDMHKELIKMHQMAFGKAKEIDTVSAYNTFVFAYPHTSQVKEANQKAYELEKKHYADIGMLGFFGKDEKMNKQARSLLIEAQSILDIALDKEKNASIVDTGYYMVVNRMYEFAKKEFVDTDRVLTLKESPELNEFDKTLQQKLQEQADNIKKIESGLIGDIVELRADSTNAVMSLDSSDSKMKEFYNEQHKKSNNFEELYQKVLNESKSEIKKVRSIHIKKTDDHSAGSQSQKKQRMTKDYYKKRILDVIENGSDQLKFPIGAMPSGMVQGADAEAIAEYIIGGMRDEQPAFFGVCAGCHGADGKGNAGTAPNLLKYANKNMPKPVNSNTSNSTKQKDRQQAQPTSNQLTDAERQELEQLRAEKAKKAAREKQANSVTGSDSVSKHKTIEVVSATPEIATSEPVGQSQTVRSNNIQNTRADTRRDGSETYYARISQRDHYGARNQKLKDVGTILQQDRANYHKYHKRDRGDTGDSRFNTRGNRDKIKRMLARGTTSQKTLNAIRHGTPLVKVKTYQNHIDVTLKSGTPQTQQSKGKSSRCNTVGYIRGISRRGDGFVAVRKGPGTGHRMINKIYRNGEKVKICDRKGKWKGIVYGDCIAGSSRSQSGSCKVGWVYGKYIRTK